MTDHKLWVDMLEDLAKERAVTCKWAHDTDEPWEGVWDTECGQLFMFANDDSPCENGFQYCPYCGHRLEEMSKLPGGRTIT